MNRAVTLTAIVVLVGIVTAWPVWRLRASRARLNHQQDPVDARDSWLMSSWRRAEVTPTGSHASSAILRHDRGPGGVGIGAGVALATWCAAWVAGMVLAMILFAVTGTGQTTDATFLTLAVAMAAGWAVYLVAMVGLSQRLGSGRFAADFGVRVRPIDVVGLPIGMLCQLVVVPVIYLPLRALWPSTFTGGRLQENAISLTDRASDPAAVALLVVMIVVGAPIIEELVYRGLIHRSLAGRFHQLVAWFAAAALFMVVHFRPVEYPGLMAFALVVGAAVVVTGRLGPAITIHIGFNGTALLLVYS